MPVLCSVQRSPLANSSDSAPGNDFHDFQPVGAMTIRTADLPVTCSGSTAVRYPGLRAPGERGPATSRRNCSAYRGSSQTVTQTRAGPSARPVDAHPVAAPADRRVGPNGRGAVELGAKQVDVELAEGVLEDHVGGGAGEADANGRSPLV